MVKTATDTAIEEKKFIEEAVWILDSLGYPITGSTLNKDIENMMKEEGYKKGYNGTWIMPEDIVPDEQ